MHASSIIYALALPLGALASGMASAVGSAKVVNNCPYAVTAWSVGSAISGPYPLSASGGLYSEVFTKDPKTGGRAIKVTIAADGLYSGAAQTIFAYSYDPAVGKVWYDLSDVFGDAFKGQKLVEASADTSCPAIVWAAGISPPGSQVKVCGAAGDVTLTLCSA